jgi:hypothetical protein
MVPRTKSYTLRLTKSELEAIQRLLESAAAGASPEQLTELEGVNAQIYRLLFPSQVEQPCTKHVNGVHPVRLRTLGQLRAIRDE